MEKRNIFQIIRDFLFSKTNREFLIFLFFLVLSGAFWLLNTLNETYEKELKIPVHIVGVPTNVVITSEEYDTIRAMVRDKGIVLITYYTQGMQPVSVNFKSYAGVNGVGSIPTADMIKLARTRVSASTTVTGVKPEKLKFYFNYGSKKRVPVKWTGHVVPENIYYLSDVVYSPDSVTVYAPEEKLDSINVIYTETLNYKNFRDTLLVDCKLRKMEGVKMIPDHIRIGFFTDVLTEESFDDVPVVGINMPAGKTLRTFPSKVKVKFVTGVSMFKTLSPNDFVVVADYNEIKKNPSDKCNIYLTRSPSIVSRASLEVKQVDYLIEETAQTEQQP